MAALKQAVNSSGTTDGAPSPTTSSPQPASHAHDVTDPEKGRVSHDARSAKASFAGDAKAETEATGGGLLAHWRRVGSGEEHLADRAVVRGERAVTTRTEDLDEARLSVREAEVRCAGAAP